MKPHAGGVEGCDEIADRCHRRVHRTIDALLEPIDPFMEPIDAFIKPIEPFIKPIDALIEPIDAFIKRIDALIKRVDATGVRVVVAARRKGRTMDENPGFGSELRTRVHPSGTPVALLTELG